jgi:hypothetical protein
MSLVFIPQPGSCARQDQLDRAPLRVAPLVAFALGTTAGGAAVATVLALVGNAAGSVSGLNTAVSLLAITAAALGVAADVTASAYRLPQRRRQVPRGWVTRMDRSKCALCFGLLLGGGVFTYLGRGAVYAIGALVVLAPSAAAGALVGVGYGLGRAVPLLIDAARSSRAPAVAIADRFGRRVDHVVGAAGLAALGVLVFAAIS